MAEADFAEDVFMSGTPTGSAFVGEGFVEAVSAVSGFDGSTSASDAFVVNVSIVDSPVDNGVVSTDIVGDELV